MRIMICAALAAAASIAQPAFAENADNDLSGLRGEVRVGWETPTVSGGGEVYKIGQSVSIGGELGYDLPVSSKVTVGPFVNYEYARSKDCAYDFCLGSDGNFAAGGRVGFALGEKSQLYVKVGYDSMKLKATAYGYSDSESLDGVQGAIGFDYNINDAFYVGIEANYADLGQFEGINFQRRHVAISAGTRF